MFECTTNYLQVGTCRCPTPVILWAQFPDVSFFSLLLIYLNFTSWRLKSYWNGYRLVTVHSWWLYYQMYSDAMLGYHVANMAQPWSDVNHNVLSLTQHQSSYQDRQRFKVALTEGFWISAIFEVKYIRFIIIPYHALVWSNFDYEWISLEIFEGKTWDINASIAC